MHYDRSFILLLSLSFCHAVVQYTFLLCQVARVTVGNVLLLTQRRATHAPPLTIKLTRIA